MNAAFDLSGLRKHIDGRDGFDAVSAGERGEVAREGCGIARDVDDFGGRRAEEKIDDARGDADGGRIEDERGVSGGFARQGIAEQKRNVAREVTFVRTGVAARLANGELVFFDADDL